MPARTVATVNEGHLQLLASDEWRQALDELIVPEAVLDVDLGDDVLEVGPGPGLTTDIFRSRVARLTAVELDPTLASALAARLDGTNVEVVEADATAMPFPDGRFSGAISFTMLHHVPTAELQDALFADVARVLAPGATFVASDSVAGERLEAFHVDDVYNPVDPTTVEARLLAAGFTSASVRWNQHGWAAHAVR